MSGHASPPPWVWALRIESGAWRCLLALWSFADYGAKDAVVYPSRDRVAQRSGQTPNAVKKQQAKLRELGLIERASVTVDGEERDAWRLLCRPDLACETEGPEAPAAGLQAPQKDVEPMGTEDLQAPCAVPTGPRIEPMGTHVQGLQAPQPFKGNLTKDLTEPSRSSTRACVADAAIDSVLLDRHREHAERQARLEAEREANRSEQRKRAARSELSAEIIAAVGEAGALWVRELETGRTDGRPTWLDDLASAVVELRLTAADVLRVLRAWDEAEAALGGPLAVARLPATGGVMPPRRGVWWTAWRPWVAAQLGAEAPAARQREQGRGSLSVGWPSNTTSSRRSFVKPKEVAQA